MTTNASDLLPVGFDEKKMAEARREFEKLPAGLRRAYEDVARIFVKRKLGTESPKLSWDGYLNALGNADRHALRLAELNALALEAAADAEPKPFPIDALGPMLAGVTDAIIEAAQCQPSLPAVTILGHVAGAVQAIADVRTPQGVLLTSAAVMPDVESSDGKGIAWKVAIGPFKEYEKELGKEHQKSMQRYKAAAAKWAQDYELAGKTSALSDEERLEALASLEGRKPRRPNDPHIVFTGGGTAEGIVKHMARRPPSCIHSVTDAAQFLRGSGFGEQNSVATGSQLIDLVDSGHSERTIKGDRNEENIQIDDRRLSQCLMIQPEIVLPYMQNTELRRLGAHARYLKTVEESIAHERVADSRNAIDLDTDPRVHAYNEATLEMLRAARFKPDVEGVVPHALDAYAVEPFTLRLTREAADLWDAYVNKITPQTAPGMRYGGEVREAARKIGEHTIRMAARLHVVDAFTCPRPSDKSGLGMMPFEIQPDVMERAIEIAHWFLDEDRRYILSLTQAPESEHERLVLDWLQRAEEGSGWKPTPAQPDGWYLTKDDRKRGPREMRKGRTQERDAVWTSMFEAMASAEPPRAYFIGDPRARGMRVRIPRSAVYR